MICLEKSRKHSGEKKESAHQHYLVFKNLSHACFFRAEGLSDKRLIKMYVRSGDLQ